MFATIILSVLALQLVTAEELELMGAKSAGYGYGYDQSPNNGYGHGYGNGYGQSHGHRRGYGNGYGHGDSYGHGQSYGGGYGHKQEAKQVPIQIPFINRNGCRFPGDVVCNPAATDSTTYGYCVLSNENSNLWKKPTMQIVVATCAPTGAVVLSDWCNDNERVLRAAGLIKTKDKTINVYKPQGKFSVSLNPCILAAP